MNLNVSRGNLNKQLFSEVSSDIKVSGHSLLPYLIRIWLVSGVLDKIIFP